MRLVFLARINRIAKVGKVGTSRISREDRDKTGNPGSTVVSDGKQRESVFAQGDGTLHIQLVLLPVLQAIKKSVPIRAGKRDPGILRRTESCHYIDITVIPRDCDKRVKLRAQPINGGDIDRMIALSHIKRAAIHLHALDYFRNKNVGIGVAISVRIG